MAKRVAVSSNFRPRKCAKAEYLSEDRISLLPDEILVIILSLLTVKEAARTSVLSKRWINLWMLIFRLDFDPGELLYEMIVLDIAERQRSPKRERRKYVKQVNKVLQLNEVLALDYFRICFDLDKSSKIEIDKWLEYAFARRVQRLELDLEGAVKFPSAKSYTFPYGPLELSCRNSTKESRSVYGGVNPSVSIDFESLKALCLRCVNVAGEVLQLFLHKCPFLERLVVHCSMDLINLEVCGPSLALKYLEISFCPKMEYIKVCDTNLVSLKVSKAEKLVLENVPMLVEAYVEGATMNDIRIPISWLSCCLSQLEVLTISTFLFENKAKLRKFPQLTRLKQLTIRATACADVGIIGITPLLAASPNLEKFVLKWLWGTPCRAKRKLEKGVICPLQHLKVVEFQGYYGRTTDLELVKYFLKNAVALEKITVDPHDLICIRCPTKWYRSYQTEKIETARSFAKKQLQALISPNIELQIL